MTQRNDLENEAKSMGLIDALITLAKIEAQKQRQHIARILLNLAYLEDSLKSWNAKNDAEIALKHSINSLIENAKKLGGDSINRFIKGAVTANNKDIKNGIATEKDAFNESNELSKYVKSLPRVKETSTDKNSKEAASRETPDIIFESMALETKELAALDSALESTKKFIDEYNQINIPVETKEEPPIEQSKEIDFSKLTDTLDNLEKSRQQVAKDLGKPAYKKVRDAFMMVAGFALIVAGIACMKFTLGFSLALVLPGAALMGKGYKGLFHNKGKYDTGDEIAENLKSIQDESSKVTKKK